MKQFWDDYFNIRKMMENKREYKHQMERINALPKDYQFVFKKIQNHMWQFVSGTGYDMMKVQCDLIDLFEEGVSNGKSVLEITGNNVAAFVDGLLENTRTYQQDRNTKLNEEISKKIEQL